MATCETVDNHGTSMASVRLKVLYTFDYQNKTNHLARYPEPLTIQKFVLGNGATVGTVELQICLQAIIKASPELLAKENQDYTIYAHDFSECDYPLVGQGLLSKILPLTTSSITSSASHCTQIISGRVYKDTHNIFTSDVKETLEVKMRLVPIPLIHLPKETEVTCTCKDSSKATINAMDSIDWSSLMQLGSSGIASSMEFNQSFGDDRSTSNQLSHQVQEEQLPVTSSVMRDKHNSGNDSSDDSSATKKPQKDSRPSRISNKRSRSRKAKDSVAGENMSSFEEGTDGEGVLVQKKRAKLQKTQWNSNSKFGHHSDPLRVVAGTTGSLRLFRPIVMTPRDKNSIVENHDDGSRAPTPIPYASERQKKFGSKPRLKLRVRRNSSLSEDSSIPTERGEDALQYSTESVDASSDRHKSPFDTETPPGMTSSPPLMKARISSRGRSSPACPSSPSLPQLPTLDMGSVCGSLVNSSKENDDATAEDRDNKNKANKKVGTKKRRHSLTKPPPILSKRNPTTEKVGPGAINPVASQITTVPEQVVNQCVLSRNDSIMSDDGQSNPSVNKNNSLQSRARPQQQKFKNITQRPEQPAGSGPRSGMIVLAPSGVQSNTQHHPCATVKDPRSQSIVSASDPIMPATSQLPQMMSRVIFPAEKPAPKIQPMSSFINMQPMSVGLAPMTMSQSVSKREMIRQKLETAIDNGEMPPFCCNCGAIETPTWRKAWSKEIKGEPGYYEYSDEPGRVTAIIILTRNAEGKPTSYNLVKKYLGENESQDDYNEYLLCNPCGIWMSKYKTSRPEERWESNSDRSLKSEPKKRPTQRLSRPKKNHYLSVPAPPSETSGYLASDTVCANNDTTECTEVTSTQEVKNYLDPQSKLANLCSPELSRDSNLNLVNNGIATRPMSTTLGAVQTNGCKGNATDSLGGQVDDSRQRKLSPSIQVESLTHQVPLGDAKTNSLLQEQSVSSLKNDADQTPGKENCDLATIDRDTEARIMQLFEEELGKEDIPRPSTPGQNCSEADLLKTPTRSSSIHGKARSSACIVNDSFRPEMLVYEPNKSPRSAAQSLDSNSISGSPLTIEANKLFDGARSSHLVEGNVEYDVSLPALSDAASTLDMNLNFSLEEFFSTDMLNANSSPPLELNFQDESLTDDVTGMNWRDLICFNYGHIQNDPEAKQESATTITVSAGTTVAAVTNTNNS